MPMSPPLLHCLFLPISIFSYAKSGEQAGWLNNFYWVDPVIRAYSSCAVCRRELFYLSYLSDFASSDYHLFLHMKKRLASQIFATMKEQQKSETVIGVNGNGILRYRHIRSSRLAMICKYEEGRGMEKSMWRNKVGVYIFRLQ